MERLQKTKERHKSEEEPEEEPSPSKDAKIENDKHHADDLLDEIDSLLEENAETFVREYVQRGGE